MNTKISELQSVGDELMQTTAINLKNFLKQFEIEENNHNSGAEKEEQDSKSATTKEDQEVNVAVNIDVSLSSGARG